MFCEKCGNKLPDHARFCAKCGNPAGNDKSGSTSKRPGKEKMIPVSNADLQKAVEEVKKAGTSAGKKASNWFADYIRTWQDLKKLQAKENYIWFGIHGGLLLLLICVIAIPKSGSRMSSMVKSVIKDGEITEEDILVLVEHVKSYKDIMEIENLVEKMEQDGRADKYGFGITENIEGYNQLRALASNVSTECIKQSGLADVVQYTNWYDQDKLREMLYEKAGRDESFFWNIEYGYIGAPSEGEEEDEEKENYDADESVIVEYYVYPDNNKITFVKITETKSDDTVQIDKDVYEGEYTVSDAELVIKLEGTEYHLAEADTDIAKEKASKFWSQAKGYWKGDALTFGEDGYWKGPAAFYSKVFPKAKMSGDEEGLYLEVRFTGMVNLIDENLNILSEMRYEQGEGTTVLFGSTSLSYRKENGILILTLDGTDYEFTKVRRVVADRGVVFEGRRSDFKIVEE